MKWIDTHCHLDGKEFDSDRKEVIQRAKDAGVSRIFIPAIDAATSQRVLALCYSQPQYLHPMVGLHPEEVKDDWRKQLSIIRPLLSNSNCIAIGEVGLDYYWSRDYAQEQLDAFECQVKWSVETQLPLMIHCRKAQNEMVAIIKRYASQLPGGVFHCFTGNDHEALELLQFDRFVLGIGGVFTFKKSHLPEVLPKHVPLNRIVIETDAPYMAPVPMRGKRNEPAFTAYILQRLAEAYGVTEEEVAHVTTDTVARVFNINDKEY